MKVVFDIHNTDFSTLIDRICNPKGKEVFLGLNANHVNKALLDREYYKILQKSYVYFDGMGPVFAAKFKGFKMPKRLATTDLILHLLEKNETIKERPKIFFLGGKQDTAKQAQENLLCRYPNAHFVGYHHGYFTNDLEVIRRINSAKPNILFIGLGCPKQEKWLDKYYDHLDCIAMLTCGGMYDYYVSNNIRRAPKWMQKIGLEWLFRLAQEPLRLGKRYTLGNIQYILNLRKFSFEYKKEIPGKAQEDII